MLPRRRSCSRPGSSLRLLVLGALLLAAAAAFSPAAAAEAAAQCEAGAGKQDTEAQAVAETRGAGTGWPCQRPAIEGNALPFAAPPTGSVYSAVNVIPPRLYSPATAFGLK